MAGGVKNARSTAAPKSERARLLARYHILADRELLKGLNEREASEIREIRASLDAPYQAAHLEMLEQIRQDRQELRRSIDEIRAAVERAAKSSGSGSGA